MSTDAPIVDIIEGTVGSHHIIAGWALTRVAVVSGIDTNANAIALLSSACDAVIAVVGDRGSTMLVDGVQIYLEQFIPEAVDDKSVRIRIVYKGYPAAQYELDACLTQVESNLDAFGNPITVGYMYTDPSGGSSGAYFYDPKKVQWCKTNGPMIQGGMLSRPVPEATFTVKWIVTAGTIAGVSHTALEVMSWYAMMFEGKINDAPYTIGLLTGAKHCWMIPRVHGHSRDGGFTYEASMTFHYREAGWDPMVIYTDPETGKPPKDLVPGLGYKDVQMAVEASFPTFTFYGN